MFLSDVDIKKALQAKEIFIEDFDESRLQPASYDLLLGFDFLIFNTHKIKYIDPHKPINGHMTKVKLKNENDFFTLHANQFVLSSTLDYFGVGPKHVCQLMGKSSLARLGLIIHATAGFIDPGNSLNATLELFNANSIPIRLHAKMKIAQISFTKLTSKCARPYGHKDLNSKYQNSRQPEASKMHKDY